TAAIAQTCTDTVLLEVTDAARATSALGSVPSDALTETGCPAIAPVTVAVPVAQTPARRGEPPIEPVVPVREGVSATPFIARPCTQFCPVAVTVHSVAPATGCN